MAERADKKGQPGTDIPSHHPDTGQQISGYEASEGKTFVIEAVAERDRAKGQFTARLDKSGDDVLQKN